MAVDVASSSVHARVGIAERASAVPARIVLAGIVVASFLFRLVAAFAHAVPVYFPDEYIYGALARSIAESGRPLVRGGPAHFPALLEPLLAAPFWLPGDPGLAYRLTQAENALFMSLAAVPVYLLARRIGLGKWFALAAGGLAVASPALFFTSFVFADPVAYPLVLAAVCAGVYALAEPTPRAQIAFATFAGLAAFARIQYVIVPVAFLAAALVVERGSVRTLVARFRASLVLLALPVLALAVVGPARVLGYYHGVVDEQIRPGALVHWFGVDAMLLAYSAGWVVVPGALLGLWLALGRSSSRAERGFAALTLALTLLILFEAGVYASNGSGRYQERYLMALVPLAAPAFGIWIRRGLPLRRALLAIVALLLLLSASVPLSGYTIGLLKQDSPFLFAVFRAEKAFGAGGGAALVAAIAGILCVVAAAVAWRPRVAATVTLGLAGLTGLAVSGAAYSIDISNAREIRSSLLPADRHWIDNSGLGRVALVLTPGASADQALEQAFWNRSVGSFLLMPGTEPPDVFGVKRLTVDRAGRLSVEGRPLRTPLAVQNSGVTVRLAGAEPVGRGGSFELWRPTGTPRLSLLALGRYSDGWLAARGQIAVWPNAAGITRGTLELRLAAPRNAPPLTLRLQGPGLTRSVPLRPGATRVVALRVNTRGPWSVRFKSSAYAVLWDGRLVSVRATVPVFRRSL